MDGVAFYHRLLLDDRFKKQVVLSQQTNATYVHLQDYMVSFWKGEDYATLHNYHKGSGLEKDVVRFSEFDDEDNLFDEIVNRFQNS